jgi:hypothetical protein
MSVPMPSFMIIQTHKSRTPCPIKGAMRGAVLGSVTAGVANHIGYGKSAFAKWAQKDIYSNNYCYNLSAIFFNTPPNTSPCFKRIQAPVTARVSIFQRIVHYITVSVVTLCTKQLPTGYLKVLLVKYQAEILKKGF